MRMTQMWNLLLILKKMVWVWAMEKEVKRMLPIKLSTKNNLKVLKTTNLMRKNKRSRTNNRARTTTMKMKMTLK